MSDKNMECTGPQLPEKQLALRKYLPFFHFVEKSTNDKGKKAKFRQMEKLIKSSQKFSSEILDKFYMVIKQEYKSVLLTKSFRLPDRIHKIFKVDSVNLCVDDNDDDDDEVVVIIEEDDTDKPTSSKCADKSQPALSASSKSSKEKSNKDCAMAISAETTAIVASVIVDEAEADTNCQDFGDEALFTRRRKVTENNNLVPENQPTTVSARTLPKPPTLTTPVEVAPAKQQSSENLDALNIKQLAAIYDNLMEKSGVDLEDYLKSLVSQVSSHSELARPNNKHLTNQNRPNMPNNTSHFSAMPSTPLCNANGFYPPPARIESATGTTSLPIDPRKINLNDPRILKRLKELENSPGMTDVVRYIAGNLSNSLITPPTAAPPQPTQPTARPSKQASEQRTSKTSGRSCLTYGEYKRRRLAEEEAERKKNEAQKQRNTESTNNNAAANIKNTHNSSPVKPASNNNERVNRVLKDLECTFKGYSQLSDYIPKTANGKRRSSISARSAIAAQLSGQCYNQVDRVEPPSNKRRRKSLDSRESLPSAQHTPSKKSPQQKRSESKKLVEKSPSSTKQDVHQNFLNCSVRLKRIKPAETSPPTEKTIGNSKSKNKSRKQHNTNAKMTERNTKVCALCRARPQNLTSHFVVKHKTESYVARLTAEELNRLQLSTPFVTASATHETDQLKNRYTIGCGICEEQLEGTFNSLHYHYSKHTGEYSFQCFKCGLLLPHKNDMKLHQKSSRCGSKIVTLYQYPNRLKVIYLHCCALCNFVQLNEANVYRHLREHHDHKVDDPTKVNRFVVAAINDANEDAEDDGGSAETELVEEPISAGYEVESSTAILSTHDGESSTAPVAGVLENILPDIPVVNEPVTDAMEPNIPVDQIKPDPALLMTDIDEEFNNLLEEMSDEEIKPEIGTETLAVPTNNPTPPMTVIHCLPENRNKPNSIIKSELCQLELDMREIAEKQLQPKYTARQQFKQYSSLDSFYGLYKCMAAECFYSTDEPHEFLQHLDEHNQSDCPPDDFLQCAYCQLSAEPTTLTPTVLVDHIQAVHARSRYQCDICSYRSCSPSNVFNHWTNNHRQLQTNIQIYECNGISDDNQPMDELTIVTEAIAKNVLQIKCPFCDLKFFALNILKAHMEICSPHEWLKKIPKLLAVKFSCVYCPKDFVTIGVLRSHLADEHYDETPYGCERLNQQPKGAEFDEARNLHVINLAVQFCNDLIKPPPQPEPPTSTVKEEIVRDQKPSGPELLKLNMWMVKPLLLKLTDKTGICPDKLYQCPWPDCGGFFSRYQLWSRHMLTTHKSLLAICPHCSDCRTLDLSLNSFEEHFEKHRRKLHVCFYCAEACISDNELSSHVLSAHHCTTSTHLKRSDVTCYLNYSYHVMMYQDNYEDELKLLQDLQPVLRERIKANEEAERKKLLSQWIIPRTIKWLDDFPQFACHAQSRIKCRMCPYSTDDAESLLQHTTANHNPMPPNVICSRCVHLKNPKSWVDVLDHYRSHMSSLTICCRCSFYHPDQRRVASHIRTEHDSCDVPIICLERNAHRTLASISIVLSSGKRTLSQKRCFCCDEQAMPLVHHLQQRHGIVLEYGCYICDELFNVLRDSERHQQDKHPNVAYKIRCHLKFNGQLAVSSVHPLSVKILDNADNRKSSKDDDDDDDIKLLDDDDLIIEEELKNIRAENLDRERKAIKCIALQNLLEQHQTEPQIPQDAMAQSNGAAIEANTQNIPPAFYQIPNLQYALPQTTVIRPLIPTSTVENSRTFFCGNNAYLTNPAPCNPITIPVVITQPSAPNCDLRNRNFVIQSINADPMNPIMGNPRTEPPTSMK